MYLLMSKQGWGQGRGLGSSLFVSCFFLLEDVGDLGNFCYCLDRRISKFGLYIVVILQNINYKGVGMYFLSYRILLKKIEILYSIEDFVDY